MYARSISKCSKPMILLLLDPLLLQPRRFLLLSLRVLLFLTFDSNLRTFRRDLYRPATAIYRVRTSCGCVCLLNLNLKEESDANFVVRASSHEVAQLGHARTRAQRFVPEKQHMLVHLRVAARTMVAVAFGSR